jgi:hypothetical protein
LQIWNKYNANEGLGGNAFESDHLEGSGYMKVILKTTDYEAKWWMKLDKDYVALADVPSIRSLSCFLK